MGHSRRQIVTRKRIGPSARERVALSRLIEGASASTGGAVSCASALWAGILRLAHLIGRTGVHDLCIGREIGNGQLLKLIHVSARGKYLARTIDVNGAVVFEDIGRFYGHSTVRRSPYQVCRVRSHDYGPHLSGPREYAKIQNARRSTHLTARVVCRLDWSADR